MAGAAGTADADAGVFDVGHDMARGPAKRPWGFGAAALWHGGKGGGPVLGCAGSTKGIGAMLYSARRAPAAAGAI